MESLARLHHCRQPLPLSFNHLPFSLSSPISSVCLWPLPPRVSPLQFSSSSFRSSSIRASSWPSESLSHSASRRPRTTLPQSFQTLNSLFSPVIRTTRTIITAAVFFYMRLHHKPAIAAPLETPTVESSTESMENSSKDENRRTVEEKLSNNPNDTGALRSLIEVKVRARKIEEAIQAIDRLIELEPEEFEWPLLKAHMYVYNGDYESAKEKFEEILTRDPYRVEAYHGLVMAASESDKPLEDLSKRVEEAVELCKNQKRESEVRDLRLLIAQIKVMEGEFNDALKAYQELVKEEPKDFRPYLCQGIIYTILSKKDEAEKQFDKFRRLIPKNHPYREYFEDNMFEMNVISRKAEREGAGAGN